MSIENELPFLVDMVRLAGYEPIKRIVSPANSLVYLAGTLEAPVIVKLSYEKCSDATLRKENIVLTHMAGVNGTPAPLFYLDSAINDVDEYFRIESKRRGIKNPSPDFFKSIYTFIERPSVLARPYIPGHDLYEQDEPLTKVQKSLLLDEMISFWNAGYSNLDPEEWNILIDQWGRPRLFDFGTTAIKSSDGDKAFYEGIERDMELYQERCTHKMQKPEAHKNQ